MPAPTQSTDVFSTLPPATFRGIAFPVSARDCDHAHIQAKTTVQYKGGQAVDITGGEALTFAYTIPFRQGLAKGNWRDLFKNVYPQFWAAYEDPSRGELFDPIRGIYNVKPGSWKEITDVNRRDGIDVQVSFAEDKDISAEDEMYVIGTVTAATSEAGALDRAVARTDWQQEPSPGPSLPLFQAISAIGDQLDAARGKVTANLHDAAAQLEAIEQSFERLNDPGRNAEPIRAARRLRLATLRLAERGTNPGKTVREIVTQQRKTVAAAAQELGMSIEDFMRENASLAKAPFVPIGYHIRYYAH